MSLNNLLLEQQQTRGPPRLHAGARLAAFEDGAAFFGEGGEGFEAVRCAGLPERLTFERVPAGLSPQPVFSVDTRDPRGGTYTVQLTYLAWGFDWQANYVATLDPRARGDRVRLRLMSWLTLLNDNGQSFPDAELLVVAGTLNVVSNFQQVADPPDARPLALTCYLLGSTAAGSPLGYPPPPPPPAPMAAMERAGEADVQSLRRRARPEREAGPPVRILGSTQRPSCRQSEDRRTAPGGRCGGGQSLTGIA